MLATSFVPVLIQAAGPSGPLESLLRGPAAASLPARVVTALAVLVLGALAIRVLAWVTRRIEARSGGTAGPISAVSAAVRLVLWILVLYLAVTVGLRPEGREAWIVGAGLALFLILGGRGLAADWLGGLLLLVERPFGPGDRIDAAGHEGVVLDAGLRSVRLRDTDGREVRIPNRRLVGAVTANASRGEPGTRVAVDVHLPVDVNLGRARRLAREAAISSPYVRLADEVEVTAASRLDGERVVRLRIVAGVLDRRDADRFRTDVLESLLEALGRGSVVGA